MSRRAAALAVLPLLLPAAAAARGGLDPSFGKDGVALAWSPIGGSAAAGYGVAADAAGRVVVAGAVTDSTGTPHIAVWRFSGRGAPDADYGRDGVSVSTEPGWAWGLTLDARGRALTPGLKAIFGKASTRAVLERRTLDGARDPAFAGGGRVEAEGPFGGFTAEGGACAVARDGTILLAGQAADGARRMRPAAWVLDDRGRFSTGVSSTSARRLSAPEGAADARVSALIARAAGGWWATGALDWRALALWRLAADGSPDWDFGAGGLALSAGVGRALAEDGADGVWAAGFAYSGVAKAHRESAVLAHFAADGSTTSWTSLPAPGLRDREAFALVRAPDGRLFAAGYADDGALPVRACVWALRPDGSLDARFGRGGVLVLPATGPRSEARVYALALDARGRLLAVGLSRADPKAARRLAVWRVNAR
ncbi:MAG: delta-60 repeat domain-containing protein [Elusimicrobia bacterium]|nr:delta-60 repeat domain-containing protein [Elusimicrobiota bacterium]